MLATLVSIFVITAAVLDYRTKKIPNWITVPALLGALVFHALPDLNWVGFYFYDGAELVVGPFQGLPACVRIARVPDAGASVVL